GRAGPAAPRVARPGSPTADRSPPGPGTAPDPCRNDGDRPTTPDHPANGPAATTKKNCYTGRYRSPPVSNNTGGKTGQPCAAAYKSCTGPAHRRSADRIAGCRFGSAAATPGTSLATKPEEPRRRSRAPSIP